MQVHEEGSLVPMSGAMTATAPTAMSFFGILTKHTVIEGQTHHGLLMAAVLPFDLSGLHTPQTCQVIRGG